MMNEFQQFFSFNNLSNMLENTQQMIGFIVLMVLLIVSIMLFMFLMSSEKKRLIQKRKFKHQTKLISANLRQSEAVLASDEQLMLIWPSQKSMLYGNILQSDNVRVIGGLQHVIGLPKTPDKLLEFANWLDDSGALKVNEALIELAESGKAFSFFVKTKAVERVELSGYVVGSEIIFKVRDLKEDRLFLARANEKWVSLENRVAQYDVLLNNCPLPTWFRDDKGSLTWVNTAYVEAVEAEDNKSVLTDHIELIAPADVYKAREYFSLGQNQTSPEVMDSRFFAMPDGKLEQQVFVVIKGERCSLKIHHQKIEGGIVATAYDITKIERIKDELKRYNQAHKKTLDKLKTAIAQFGPDQNLEFYNKAYQELFEMDAKFLDSKPSMSMVLDQIRALKKMPEQVNFKAWRDTELEAFSQVESNEHWWYLPNGSTLYIVSDPHPFGGVTFLYDDVSEHMALESNYKKLDQMQAETLDHLSDGVAVFNSNGDLQISNPAFAHLWNFEADALSKKIHVNDVLDWCKNKSDKHDAQIWTALKTSVTAIMDERMALNGRVNCLNDKIVDYAAIPLPNSSTLMTFTDVTIVAKSSNLLTEHNEALLAADKLKSDFISHVSYQFREPLTNILGFSEMLEGQVFGALNGKQLEYIDIIRSSSFGLRALINDVLDLASLDADRMELKVQDVDIVDVINSSVNSVKLPIEKKNIVLNRIIMPAIGTFEGDVERVSQVLYNLLSNAIYYSNVNSIVSVGAERENEHIRLWVRDAGVGIAPEKITSIFEKFNSDKPNGAGLGLSLVKELVEIHGGEVGVASQPNKGTIVSCYFPIKQSEKPLKKELEMVVPKEIETAKLDNIKLIETHNEPKKLTPREQLELLRNKTKTIMPKPVKISLVSEQPSTDAITSEDKEAAEQLADVIEEGANIESSQPIEIMSDLLEEQPDAPVNNDVVEGVIEPLEAPVKPASDAASAAETPQKGIFGNARLAALYQRSKFKKTDETENDQ